jgi:hypothetical protein
MAILIKQKEEKKIFISGTDLELTEVYGRIEFAARADGKTLEINVGTFVNKAEFKKGNRVATNITSGNIMTTLEEGELQSVETAHKYAKLAYEQAGYDVIIDIQSETI